MHKRLIAAVTVLILAVAGLGFAVVSRDSGDSPEPSASPTVPPTSPPTFEPSNLLVTVTNTDKRTSAAILQGVSAESRPVSMVNVPVNLSVDIDSKGLPQPLSKFSAPEIGSSSYQVSNQLGLLIDGGWAMEAVAFAALVDSVGGVTLGKAERLYTGKETAKFVLEPNVKGAKGRTLTAVRFNIVWRKVLTQLTNDQARLFSVLTSLGATSQRTLGVSDLAEQILRIKKLSSTNGISQGSFAIEAVGARPMRSVTLKWPATQTTIKQLFPNTEIVPGVEEAKSRVRFVLTNTSGAAALEAKNKIYEAGFNFVWGGPLAAGAKVPKRPVIYVATPTLKTEVGAVLAGAFGIDPKLVKVSPEQTVGVQAKVMAS
ncbi:MAG: hypothetical protein WAS05_03780 [Candidatus Nanopelagicales bacterium]